MNKFILPSRPVLRLSLSRPIRSALFGYSKLVQSLDIFSEICLGEVSMRYFIIYVSVNYLIEY